MNVDSEPDRKRATNVLNNLEIETRKKDEIVNFTLHNTTKHHRVYPRCECAYMCICVLW